MAAEIVRESVIAGTWYPDHPQTLRKEINGYLSQAAASPLNGDLVGLVVPHAGYRYSGNVAAFAYKLLQDQPFDRVLILAPSHRVFFKGASIYHAGGFQTPLGIVPLDREIVDELLKDQAVFTRDLSPHAQEHSLEIQLPFLQSVLDRFKLTPVVMGDQSIEFCRKLAKCLVAACRGKRILLIASSDLSHYHSYKEARDLDRKVLDCVSSFDPEGLAESLNTGKCEACGAGPIMTVMLAAREMGAGKSGVLHYANSGDVTGDHAGVVGYMAAAFFAARASAEGRSRQGKVGVDLGLSDEEKEALRQLAYASVRGKCLGQPPPEIPSGYPRLSEPRGAFVSIRRGEELRGCIGMIEARAPLHETVRNMAVQAAFADPRFCAVDKDEIDQIHIEISVLTPLERIEDISQIEIGKHGLFIRKGFHSGLLLPQVATEHDWDRDEFLQWTCRKAGLTTDAWKEAAAEIYVFSADVF
jgi:AmmeMemoRadiSam system protein B/AmmeMemoRadiSam system protein A